MPVNEVTARTICLHIFAKNYPPSSWLEVRAYKLTHRSHAKHDYVAVPSPQEINSARLARGVRVDQTKQL